MTSSGEVKTAIDALEHASYTDGEQRTAFLAVAQVSATLAVAKELAQANQIAAAVAKAQYGIELDNGQH
jgi:primosomal protein N''